MRTSKIVFVVVLTLLFYGTPILADEPVLIPGAAANEFCEPNSTDGGLDVGPRCIAGAEVSARGYFQHGCLTRLPVPDEIYDPGECGGRKSGIEAIAHTRAIKLLSVHIGYAVAGNISPDVQWELRFSGSRPDIAYYDSTSVLGAADVQMIEVRQFPDQRDAPASLTGYVNRFAQLVPESTVVRKGRVFNEMGYRDTFGVRESSQCSSGAPKVQRYEVVPGEADGDDVGVLWVKRLRHEETDCDGDGQPDTSPSPADEIGTPFPIPRDANEDGLGGSADIPEIITDQPREEEPVVVCTWICVDREGIYVVWRDAVDGTKQAMDITGDKLRDLGQLLQDSMRGGVWGDPHIVTVDGTTYSLQSAGEFDLLMSEQYDLQLQGRFVPLINNVSVLRAVATTLGNHTVEFSNSGLFVEANSVLWQSGRCCT